MGIIELVVYIAIIGLVVWAITTLVPMPPAFKTVIMVVAILLVLLFLLQTLGGSGPRINFG